MALTSISPLSTRSLKLSFSSTKQSVQKPFRVVCQISSEMEGQILDFSINQSAANNEKSKNWRAFVSTALAAAAVACSSNMSAIADLNKYKAETRGEFGIGSAAQFGSADLRKAVHVNEPFW